MDTVRMHQNAMEVPGFRRSYLLLRLYFDLWEVVMKELGEQVETARQDWSDDAKLSQVKPS